MDVKRKSASSIAYDIINRIANGSNIDTITPGSVIHTISLAVGNEISKIYSSIIELFSNTYLSETSGPYLNALGAIVGVNRTYSDPISEITGVRFYTDNGSPLSDFIAEDFFSTGIKCYTATGNNYYTIRPFTLSAEQLASSYVDVRLNPERVETAFAERGDFSIYEPPVNGLSCTNLSRIRLLTQSESDDQYRYRISRYVPTHRSYNGQSLELSNETALRIAALATPGVADVVIDRYSSGPGTLTMYVVGEDLINDESLPGLVYTNCLSITPWTNFTVSLPSKTYITIKTNIYSDVDNAVDIASESARTVIDSVRIGGTIRKYDIHNSIYKTSEVLSADNIEIRTTFYDKNGVLHSAPFASESYSCTPFEKLVASTNLIVSSWA